MNSWQSMGKGTALVTGASSGIGLELARELATNGHSLIMVARDPVKLAQAVDDLRAHYSVEVAAYAYDLSKAGAAEDLWRDVVRDGLDVEILVNNAGIGAYGEFQDQPVEVLTRMQMLNVLALTTLTRLALPAMLARKSGRILNVASVVGYQPGGARWAVYYATKAYVLSFSKGLARELAGSGISVTTLSPGLTRSSFEETAGAGSALLYRLVPQMSAQAVAKAGYRAMMRGRRAVIPGLITKLLAFAGELPPRAIALEVNRWLLAPRAPPHRLQLAPKQP